MYTYDDNGNITSISDGIKTVTYVYDSANQLIRENNQAGNYTYTWVYDDAGNILSKKEYPYTTGTLGTPTDTVNYTYGNSQWGDLLTGYDSRAFFYDTVGNLTNDGERTYTWKHGRQLATLSDGTTTWSYTYNADGLRTKKTDGTTTYSYVYNGGQLTQMTVGTDTLYFSYDASGRPMTVTHNGTVYHYVLSLQGDVILILDDSGNMAVSYVYDAWGNTIAGYHSSTLGALNPLRYRGYVYDTETSLYYLQSRYYDPTIGRFLNADSLVSTGQGLLSNNMFAYCLNNPVNMVDIAGAYPVYIIKGVETTINDGIYTTTITYITYDSDFLFGYYFAPTISVDFCYTISDTGSIQMSNKDNSTLFLHNRAVLNALSKEMQYQAKQVRKEAQKGRTAAGITFEIVVHSVLYALGLRVKNAEPIDMGSSNKNNPDYDYNADWFERPFKNIGKILKELFRGRG